MTSCVGGSPIDRRRFCLDLLAAFLLDRGLGDPQAWPHPVRVLGRAVKRAEGLARRHARGPRGERAAGNLMVLAMITLCFTVGLVVDELARRIPLARLVRIYLLYACLASKELERCALKVAYSLRGDNEQKARRELGKMVARDTDGMGSEAICRAAVESTAENTVDGILAPLFYAALGGLSGALAHKAASTMDSMLGYRQPPYTHLGWAPARLDDLLVFPVARLAIPVIALASAVAGEDWRAALRVGWRDRLLHESPNSAHGEAAYAGALGVALGGNVSYGGRVVVRPVIGKEGDPPGWAEVVRAARLCRTSSWVAMGLVVAACLGSEAIIRMAGRPGE